MINTVKSKLIKVRNFYRRLLHKNIISLTAEKGKDKKVLLSYITRPFDICPNHYVFYRHSNQWECMQIAKTWLNHGYDVEVIDWDNNTFVPQKDYSVFIDIHSNMERLAPLLNENCYKILHITGAHWSFQNDAEIKRIINLKARKGVELKPRRIVMPSNGIEFADCATILGNKFTQETFTYANKPLYPIPLSTTIRFPYLYRDYDKVKKNFLWLGSAGMVHKGLDLVLDVFSELPDYNLTICGHVNREKDFNNLYFNELYNKNNIRMLGFVDVCSKQFLDIITNTSALIYPSCSEGQAGSVITCLHAGLIPIISIESGVDVNDFGIILKTSTHNEIREAIIELSKKSRDDLQQMSKKAWIYAQNNHTQEKFAECYNRFVEEILPHLD